MFQYTIQGANIALAFVGVALLIGGPYIIYATVRSVLRERQKDPNASLHVFNNGINLIIGVLFFFAGICFIVNNLRGNPLA